MVHGATRPRPRVHTVKRRPLLGRAVLPLTDGYASAHTTAYCAGRVSFCACMQCEAGSRLNVSSLQCSRAAGCRVTMMHAVCVCVMTIDGARGQQ